MISQWCKVYILLTDRQYGILYSYGISPPLHDLVPGLIAIQIVVALAVLFQDSLWGYFKNILKDDSLSVLGEPAGSMDH
jgi:hypothetical protein